MKRGVQLVGLVAILSIGLGSAAVKLGAYATNGHVWGVSQIPYYINPNNLYVSQADAIADIQQGAADWNTQSGVNARFSYAGNTNAGSLALDYTNNVFFRNDASGYIAETYWWWDGSGRLATATTLPTRWPTSSGTCWDWPILRWTPPPCGPQKARAKRPRRVSTLTIWLAFRASIHPQPASLQRRQLS